jgi:hypothetical protein
MQAIESAQLKMFALIKSYNITMIQRTGPFRARKAVIANAINESPEVAIQILGTTDVHKAFDRCFDVLSNGVEREAIRLFATNDCGNATREVMHFYSKAKTAILAAYRLPSDNFVMMLDAITENPERLNGITYPIWMESDSNAPIASFMVFNRVRNLFAHPEKLESTLRYNKSLRDMYEQLRQETSSETSSSDGSCQTDDEVEWVMPCVNVESGMVESSQINIPIAIPVDEISMTKPVGLLNDQPHVMHSCQTLTAEAENMLVELEMFVDEELRM